MDGERFQSSLRNLPVESLRFFFSPCSKGVPMQRTPPGRNAKIRVSQKKIRPDHDDPDHPQRPSHRKDRHRPHGGRSGRSAPTLSRHGTHPKRRGHDGEAGPDGRPHRSAHQSLRTHVARGRGRGNRSGRRSRRRAVPHPERLDGRLRRPSPGLRRRREISRQDA